MNNTKIHSKVSSMLASQEIDVLFLMEYYGHRLQDFYGSRIADAVTSYLKNNTRGLTNDIN